MNAKAMKIKMNSFDLVEKQLQDQIKKIKQQSIYQLEEIGRLEEDLKEKDMIINAKDDKEKDEIIEKLM